MVKHTLFSSPIKVCATCALIVLAVVLATDVRADSVAALQWEITADKLTRYEDPPSVIAEGNVVLEKKEAVARTKSKDGANRWGALLGEEDQPSPQGKVGDPGTDTEIKTMTTIKADWMAYDIDLGQVKARGNLFIDIGPDKLKAESGVVDLNKETGAFDNATIVRQYKDMHFEGRVIEKTGDLTYHIEDGWVVTCKLQKGETPPWSFAAADAEITDGGYAFLKHATFRIKDIPVLYTPIMILPAKRKRQTGFLFPSISTSSRDGFGLETPFFINLSPSSDMTLYPKYMANRGLMTGAEFRYVLDEGSKGVLMGNYLYDDLSDPSEVEYYDEGNFTHTNQDRYWVRGKADQRVGDWITRLDLDIVSDSDYLKEFNTGALGFTGSHEKYLAAFGRGFQNKTETSRNNTLDVLRSWDNGMALQAELLGVNDVREPEASQSPLWKLPSANFTGLLPVAESGTDFSWDAGYVNYWREKGIGAQRVDLVPLVTTAVPLSQYLETTVFGGVRDTLYFIQENGNAEWDGSDTENRFLIDAGGEIGTTLMRDFAVTFDEVNAWNHTLRPYVGYEYTVIPDEKRLPRFDSVDTLEERNAIYYGVDNFFRVLGRRGERDFERDFAYFKVRQGYDVRSEESDTPLTPVEIDTGIYPVKNTRLRYRTDIDVYGDGMFYHAIEADYLSGRGDLFVADYRYNSLTDIDSVSGRMWFLLPFNFAAGYGIERDLDSQTTIEEKISLLYQPACWSVELSSNYTPGDTTYLVTFRLANLGNPLGLDFPSF